MKGGTKVYISGTRQMTKMAATPIYNRNLNKIFLSTRSPLKQILCLRHRGLKLYTVYLNDDPGLTFTYFKSRSNVLT